MSKDQPDIVLSEVVYRTLGNGDGSGRLVTVTDAVYRGVIERRSDGYTVLSMTKLGASRAFNVEVGALLSVKVSGATWEPETHVQRWRLRAAELRAFIEGSELEDWAKPYFDPGSDKHHAKRPIRDWSTRPADETRVIRRDIPTVPDKVSTDRGKPLSAKTRKWPDVLPAEMPDLRGDAPRPPEATAYRRNGARGFMDAPSPAAASHDNASTPNAKLGFFARIWRSIRRKK